MRHNDEVLIVAAAVAAAEALRLLGVLLRVRSPGVAEAVAPAGGAPATVGTMRLEMAAPFPGSLSGKRQCFLGEW
jgi:hypothetical protein